MTIIGHDNHIIEISGDTWDLWDPPTPQQVEEAINIDGLIEECPDPNHRPHGFTGITVVDVGYHGGSWWIEYEEAK